MTLLLIFSPIKIWADHDDHKRDQMENTLYDRSQRAYERDVQNLPCEQCGECYEICPSEVNKEQL